MDVQKSVKSFIIPSEKSKFKQNRDRVRVSIQIFQLRQQGWLNKEGGREGGGVSNQLIKPK